MLTFGYDADAVKSGSEVQVTNGTMESHAADLSDALARLRLGTASVNPRFQHDMNGGVSELMGKKTKSF